MKNVFDLAQEDTSLKKVSHKEYAGRCPACSGSDRFRVQPYGKDGGSWMCRNCWNPTDYLPEKGRKRGWGDGIDYLRHYRNMSFTAAKEYLYGQVDSTLDRVRSLQQTTSTQPGKIPSEYWQTKYEPYVKEAEKRLWTPEGQTGLDYLLTRGLEQDTIEKAHLGYAIRNGRPCIVIPWFDERENGYWRVSLRDITPGIPKTERYKNTLPGFSGDGMYLGDSLLRKLPTFLVEGELDALSLAQEAGDIVNVVATGSTGNAQVPKWELRLARMPSVLVAFDREVDKGDVAAQYWLKLLNGVTPVLRYRPLEHDVNDMLTQGYSIRSWVEAALEYLSNEEEDSGSQVEEPPVAAADISSTHTATAAAQEQELDTTTTWLCSQCGIDLTSIESACYSEDCLAYCDYNQDTGAAYCSRATRTPYRSQEQVLSTANRLAQELDADCSVTPLEPGYTLEQHIERLKQEALAAQALAAEPSELEREIITRLQGYNLFVGDRCHCGCRLKWPVAGGMLIECARCEPGGLWSSGSLALLRETPYTLKRAG